jgi:predicted DNA-binding transcriptional regulator AlpA
MDQKSSQDLLQENEVAQLLTVSVAALRRWRVERRGPKYIKLGALVRYRRSDVELWISTRPFGGEADQTKRSPRLGKSAVVTGGAKVG